MAASPRAGQQSAQRAGAPAELGPGGRSSAGLPLRTPMERAPWPELGTALVPKERYTSAAYARLEWERMWTRTWLLAGLESDLREPGDYVTCQIADQNIFVMRGKDGTLRGFYNVCSHRAHELLKGSGTAKVIVCPYHAWSYHSDGRLRAARGSEKMASFDAGDGVHGFGGAGQGVSIGVEWGALESGGRWGAGYTFFSSQEVEDQPRDTKTNGDWNMLDIE